MDDKYKNIKNENQSENCKNNPKKKKQNRVKAFIVKKK